MQRDMRGTPTDFLSFHAKGSPSFVDGHVRLGISAQLAEISRAFAMIAGVPELKDKPIVIGESRSGRMRGVPGPTTGLQDRDDVLQLYGRERGPRVPPCRQVRRQPQGALTWAFEFEDQPYFAGQRVLSTNGIDLPVLNVFRMLSQMGGKQSRGREHRRGSPGLDRQRRRKELTGCRGAREPQARQAVRAAVALPRRRRCRT